MAKSSITNISANNTFQAWLDKTNEVVDIIKTETVTASVSGDTTGSLASPFTANLIGTFTANNVNASTLFRANNISPLVGSSVININAPAILNTTTRLSLDIDSTARPIIRLSNPTLSWDVGFVNDASGDFCISTGVGDARLKLSSAGNLTVSGNFVSDGFTIDTTQATIDGALNVGGNVVVTGNVGVTANNFIGNLIGNVTGNISGTIEGNAESATRLATARTFSITGAVATTAAVSFNGTSNVTFNVIQQNDSVNLGTHTVGAYVQSISGSGGISVTGSGTEGSTPIISNTDPGSAQAIFKNIAVSGQGTIVADNNNDTLIIAAGSGISITTNAGTDTLTITNTLNPGITSGEATSIAQSAAQGAAIGWNQTWQQPARSQNTLYQNLTGKPIMVSITSNWAVIGIAPSQVSVSSAGPWIGIDMPINGGDFAHGQFIVPNNHWYRNTGGFILWAELR